MLSDYIDPTGAPHQAPAEGSHRMAHDTRLLGDIGGTHARWAWQAGPGAPVGDVEVMRCADHASLLDAARHYLARRGETPHEACIGIATPVTGDAVRMTNHPWSFSIEQVRRDLGLARLLVINDFTALATSLPALGPDDLRALGAPRAAPLAGAPRALLGPGTGLGVSGLVPCGSGWQALAGEGGHVTLAAADDEDAAVLAHLRRHFDHVSAERVLSGAGLVTLAEAAGALAGRPARTLTPAEVTAHARAGDDPDCTLAVRWFTGFLGNVAGNLALTLGARGGVYIGGGVVPRLGDAFDGAHFRRRFEAKGRFAAYLAPVPTWLITAATPALLGAALALDAAPAD
jgi:glucokinase